MPKRRELEPWEQNLVSAIKEQHRFGYSVRPMRGKVQVQRFWSDTGKRETVTLPVAWEKGCQRDVLNGINAINDGLQKGLSLKTAAALAFDATTPGPKAKTNWLRVVDHYHQFKVENGLIKESTWQKEYVPRLSWLVETVSKPDAPSNGKTLLEAMRWGSNGVGEPGSISRKRRIQYCADFLRYAVDECGVDQRWAPPRPSVIKTIIGSKAANTALAPNEGQAIALTDDQFLRLFESIKDQRWRMAVGLLGVFGLRAVELNYCSPGEQGLLVTYEKRNNMNKTRPREVPVLDPEGHPGLGQKLLLMLGTGLVPMPPLGNSDGQAGISVNQALNRNPVWQELRQEARKQGKRLSSYSLRHCFADRCAMSGSIPPKAAAAAMGHSLNTHLQVYQKNYNQKEVFDVFDKANSEVTEPN